MKCLKEVGTIPANSRIAALVQTADAAAEDVLDALAASSPTREELTELLLVVRPYRRRACNIEATVRERLSALRSEAVGR